MKIEMVVPSLIRAGLETVTARLALRLGERGHSVGVTCLLGEGALAAELRQAGVRVSLVPSPGMVTLLWPLALVESLRHLKPDVAHIHSGVWPKAARAARLARVPAVVFTEHGALDVEPWHSSIIKRWSARQTDRVVAVSDALRDVLVNHHGLPERKVVVIPNGVDTEFFSPGARSGVVRDLLGLHDEVIIGHVARLVPVKNQMLMIEAFAQLHSRVPLAHLVLVGEGELKSAIEARIDALNLRNAVHLIGERSDIRDVLRDFDIFALPSHAEGTSMSVLEAMATGLPIVASAVGGTPVLLDGGTSGVLVPPNDRTALATAFTTLVLDRDLRARLGTSARSRAERQFSESAVTSSYERLYRDPRAYA